MADVSLILEPETPADAEAILRLNERVFGQAASPAPPIACARPRRPTSA